MRTEYATVDDRQGRTDRSRARAIAEAMATLKREYVPCARCQTRSATHVGAGDLLVCRDCRRTPARSTITAARERLRAAVNG
jgi:hypothetical protein